ncbi:hypothetical protein GQ600_22600 [Phytophthora cactorum]|nr:hypothetical protein GQ600_22600 [Phytophthora cactorum]
MRLPGGDRRFGTAVEAAESLYESSTCFDRSTSGPVIRHPLIVEATTNKVESLADFKLSLIRDVYGFSNFDCYVCRCTSESTDTLAEASPDVSIIAVWGLVSEPCSSVPASQWTPRPEPPTPSPCTSRPASSSAASISLPLSTPNVLHMSAKSSENSRVGPWSLIPIRKSTGTWRIHTPRTPEGEGEVPLCSGEAYASDGYDEGGGGGAEELIKGLRFLSQKRSSPQSANGSSPQSGTSQDANHAVSEQFVPEPLPKEVTLLTEQ